MREEIDLKKKTEEVVRGNKFKITHFSFVIKEKWVVDEKEGEKLTHKWER